MKKILSDLVLTVRCSIRKSRKAIVAALTAAVLARLAAEGVVVDSLWVGVLGAVLAGFITWLVPNSLDCDGDGESDANEV